MRFFLIFCAALSLCLVRRVPAGLIDTIASIDNKNDTGLPHKTNRTSKYDCLLDADKNHLDVALDAHGPVKYTLKAADEKNVDVNKLNEKELEAIGDAAMAQKLTEKPSKTTRKWPSKDKGGKEKNLESEKCKP